MSFFTIFNPLTIGYAYGIMLYANHANIINKISDSPVLATINILSVTILCGSIADIFCNCLSSDAGKNIVTGILFLLVGKQLYKFYKSIN